MKLARLAAGSAALLLSVFAGRPLSAQAAIFGMNRSSASDVRQQFVAEARQQVGALLTEYESAWGSRNVPRLARLYAGGAMLYPAGAGMLTGQGAIREYFGRLLPGVQPLRTRMVEFRASGDMAFTTLQVAYDVGDGTAGRSVMSTDVMVLRRDELGVWTIVSHLSRLEGAAVAARAASADSVAQ